MDKASENADGALPAPVIRDWRPAIMFRHMRSASGGGKSALPSHHRRIAARTTAARASLRIRLLARFNTSAPTPMRRRRRAPLRAAGCSLGAVAAQSGFPQRRQVRIRLRLRERRATARQHLRQRAPALLQPACTRAPASGKHTHSSRLAPGAHRSARRRTRSCTAHPAAPPRCPGRRAAPARWDTRSWSLRGGPDNGRRRRRQSRPRSVGIKTVP